MTTVYVYNCTSVAEISKITINSNSMNVTSPTSPTKEKSYAPVLLGTLVYSTGAGGEHVSDPVPTFHQTATYIDINWDGAEDTVFESVQTPNNVNIGPRDDLNLYIFYNTIIIAITDQGVVQEFNTAGS
jgi:hypothetical protein